MCVDFAIFLRCLNFLVEIINVPFQSEDVVHEHSASGRVESSGTTSEQIPFTGGGRDVQQDADEATGHVPSALLPARLDLSLVYPFIILPLSLYGVNYCD